MQGSVRFEKEEKAGLVRALLSYMRGSERPIRLEKRKLLEFEEADDDDDDDEEEEEEEGGGRGGGGELRKKRRRLGFCCSEISEACAIKFLQKYIEPVIRKVVGEEFDAALSKHSLANATSSNGSSTEQSERPDQWNLRLQFESGLPTSLYTEENVEAEQGGAIKVVLLDASTGCVRTSGPESSLTLEVVVLEGDFNNNKDEAWTELEFEVDVVKAREGKRHLLQGNLQVILNKGVGALGNVLFTDNSSWVRSKKFRLGVKVASGVWKGRRIQEAKTNAFKVKDHRGKSYKKHHPPALDDPVWRLEKIGKDGKFHNRLNEAGICTVRDILRHLVRDPKKFRNILGSGLSNKMWEGLVNHARTCALDGKQYVYHHGDSRNVGVIFNDIYELEALFKDGCNYPVDSFSDDMKVYVDKLVKEAYDNLGHITEYVNFKQTTAGMGRTCISDLQETATSLPTPITLEPPMKEGSLPPGGIASNGDPTTKRSMHPPNLSSCFHLSASSSSQNEPKGISQETKILVNDGMLELAPGFSPFSELWSNNGFQSSFFANSHFIDECLSPYEMLGGLNCSDMFLSNYNANVGLHDKLHVPYKETGVSSRQTCIQGEGQIHPSGASFQQNSSLGEDQVQSSRRAFLRWLKIKAIVLWGICIRSKVAKKAKERLVPVSLF